MRINQFILTKTIPWLWVIWHDITEVLTNDDYENTLKPLTQIVFSPQLEHWHLI